MVLTVCFYVHSARRFLNALFTDKLTTKAHKITIKLPWEIATIYTEVLKQSGHQSDDEEDEDDIEAHEASIMRLKVPSFYASGPRYCLTLDLGSR